MELKFQKADVKRLFNGDFELTLTVTKRYAAELEQFVAKFKPGETWAASIKKYRPKRSQDANSYCWTLIGKLAEKLAETNPDTKTPTKDEIYRRHIKEVGVYEPMPIKAAAVSKFGQIWSERGTGWFIEVVDDSKLPGYKRIHAYYGSSCYDSKEMARLIDNIVQDCKALGIETLPPQEIQRLKEEWRK